MILTGDSRCTRIETCLNVILPTTNRKWTTLKSEWTFAVINNYFSITFILFIILLCISRYHTRISRVTTCYSLLFTVTMSIPSVCYAHHYLSCKVSEMYLRRREIPSVQVLLPSHGCNMNEQVPFYTKSR
jgi:hypothetical protein